MHLLESYNRASAAQDAISSGATTYTYSHFTYQTKDASAAFRQMASDGFDLADTNCLDFFRSEGNRQQWIIFGRDVVGAVGTLATAATAAAGSPIALITGFSIATATGYNGLDIYQRNFLFGADNIDSVRKLVTNGMLQQRTAIFANPTPWISFGQAQNAIMEYQASCMPAAILESAKTAIETATSKVDPNRSSLDEKQAFVVINTPAGSGSPSSATNGAGTPLPNNPSPGQSPIVSSSSPRSKPEDPVVNARLVKLYHYLHDLAIEANLDPSTFATSKLRKIQAALKADQEAMISDQQGAIEGYIDYELSISHDKMSTLNEIESKISVAVGKPVNF